MWCIIVLLFIITLLLLPMNSIFKTIKINYELKDEANKTYIYYSSNNEIIGVANYNISNNKYERIKEVFQYLTEKSNSVSEKYQTNLNLNSKLVSYEVVSNDIFLEVNEHFFDIENSKALLVLTQINHSYKELGFNDIYLKFNGKILDDFFAIPTYNGIKNMATNVVYLASNTDTKTVKVIYINSDNTKTFVNYIINNNVNNVDFILKQLTQFTKEEYNLELRVVSYVLKDNYVVFNFISDEMDEKLIKEIFDQNFKNAIYDFN